jgi:hypothetical protein
MKCNPSGKYESAAWTGSDGAATCELVNQIAISFNDNPSNKRETSMKPKSDQDNTKTAVDKMLFVMYQRAKAQFGNAIQSFWFHDSDICPCCNLRPVGEIRYKGEKAVSLNTFIYRQRGVLIGYFLCETCAKQILKDAQKHPYTQTSFHTAIEKNLIAAFTASHPRTLI